MKRTKKVLILNMLFAIFFISGSVSIHAQLAGLDQALGLGSLIKSDDDKLMDESELEDEKFPSSKRKEKDKKEEEEENKKKPKLEKPIDLKVRVQPKLLDNELEKFGFDLFEQAPTTFAPATDIPIPGNYVIGPGDNIKVILYGKDSDIFTVEVTRGGEIYFPQIGPIVVAGLTFDEMKKNVKEIIEKQLVGVQVSINLGKLRSIQVFILGDAYQPGSYTVSALSTITNAIFVSGGINDNGSLRNIKLKRSGEVIQDFDFYDLLLNGDTSSDSRLEPGDVIFIPPSSKLVGASGEFRRPALYELLETDNFQDLINIAGGLLPTADRNSGQIERILQNDGITMIDLDLSANQESMKLLDGDIIYAYPVPNKMDKVILISSFFSRPGFYQWKEGMRIDDVINSYNNLLPETDLNYVLIKREDSKTKEYSALQIDLEELFVASNEGSNSLILNNRDEIFLFTRKNEMFEDSEEDLLEERIKELETQLINQAKMNDPDSAASPVLLDNSEIESIEQDQSLREEKKYSGLTLDQSKTMLVVKGDNVLVIGKEDFTAYQSQGFKEALQKQDFIDQALRNEQLYNGDRNKLIDPFIKILRSQAKTNQLAEIVSISGNIFFSGEYPYTPNMTVEDLIKAGGGFRQSTYLNDIEITRQTPNDKDFAISRINLTGDNLSTKVLPGDRLQIKGLTQLVKKVEIEGEVYFPGSYYLKDGETITELIQRAGGFKPDAFLAGAFFQRESIKEAEKIRLVQAQKILRKELVYASTRTNELGSGNAATDLSELLVVLEDDVDPIGRLVLDLDSIYSNSSEDLVLEDMDKLIIPKKLQSVSVIGEIYVPTAHLFQPGNTVYDYISLSGGSKKMSADTDSIYVIKANGSVELPTASGGFFRGSRGFIESGDTIVVPLKTNQFSNIKAASEISQILYQIAVATAAIQSLN